MSMFQRWGPNIEQPADLKLPPLDPHRPPFVPANEQQEAFLATVDYTLAVCDAELERLRAAKPQTGGVS